MTWKSPVVAILALAIAASALYLHMGKEDVYPPRLPALTRAHLMQAADSEWFELVGRDIAEKVRVSGMRGRAAWDGLPPTKKTIYVISSFEPELLYQGTARFVEYSRLSPDAPVLGDLVSAYRFMGQVQLADALDVVSSASKPSVEATRAADQLLRQGVDVALRTNFVKGHLDDCVPQ